MLSWLNRVVVAIVVSLSLSSVWLPSTLAQDRRGPFTAEPRSVRSRDIDQRHTRLEMRVDLDKQEVLGRAIHRLAIYRPTELALLDAAEMAIDKVRLVGTMPNSDKDLKYEHQGHGLAITLDRTYKPGETLQIAIDYRLNRPAHGAHFVVPDPSEPDQPRMMWTQGEPDETRYWYPCVDSPADRITSETVITAASKYFVLSNGSLKSRTENADGTRTWHWVQEKTHLPYLMSVVVGEFDAYEQSWDGIPIVSYVPKGRLDQAPTSFEKTPKMMEFFSRKIGYRYPWPKYTQICVDEYEWGGMEHTSATTLNLRTLHDKRANLDVSSDGLVAHELAHQWWGDVVTCKDWGELWLNESFATYFATLWTEEDRGIEEATWERHGEAEAYLNEDRTVRRSIVNYRYNAPMNMFDSHSYPKGGRVLHMLRFELGDELFWKALNRYIEVNQFRVVETADLRSSIEEATGQGLNWFFDQWLYHGGHPDFQVKWSWDESTKMATVMVKQTQKVDATTPLFRTSVEIELANQQTSVMRRVTVSKAEETYHFALEKRPTRVCFDPKDWVLKTVKFEKSKEELLDQLAYSTYVMSRWEAAKALAELPVENDVRAALLKAARADAFWPVRREAIKALAKTNGDEIRAALIATATGDAKSFVRREALTLLGNVPHQDTKAALRAAIKNDQSYYAVADALRSLVKVDREQCAADLLAALDMPSHHEVVLQAACDGLVEIKSSEGANRLIARLEPNSPKKLTPEERVVIVGAAARLRPDDAKYLSQLRDQLDNERNYVRRSAIDLLVQTANPQAIDWLTTRRAREQNRGVLQAIDRSVETLRGKAKDLETLRKELQELKRQNQALEERLKKLEGKQ